MEIRHFTVAYEHQAIYDSLPDEEAGRLIKSLFDYEVKRILPIFNLEDEREEVLHGIFFWVLKPYSDKQRERYIAFCEKQRNNVQKRYEK